jgi:HPt (histidine-containing phosphotransfer) domain-containing protein
MQTINEMALDASRRSADIYEEATGALLEAQFELEQRIREALPSEDTSGYRSAWHELNQELALLMAQRAAFKAGEAGINPPTVKMLEKAQHLAEDLRKMDAMTDSIMKILSLAQKTAATYHTLHKS